MVSITVADLDERLAKRAAAERAAYDVITHQLHERPLFLAEMMALEEARAVYSRLPPEIRSHYVSVVIDADESRTCW